MRDDIKTKTPLEHVRQNPTMYLGKDSVLPDELAMFIANDALNLGAKFTAIARLESWWVVGADIDWLLIGHEEHPEDLFFRLLPLEGGGQNALRREILLAAFAKDIRTIESGSLSQTIIQGSDEECFDGIFSLFEEFPQKFQRLLAFRV